MNLRLRFGLLVISALTLLVLTGCITPDILPTLTIDFVGMTPHIGQMFEIRLIDKATAAEIADDTIPAIASANFSITFASLPTGKSYSVEFYADVNGNGEYDGPPTDHAWRIDIFNVQDDVTVEFTHNTDFTDIAWSGGQPTGVVIDGEIAVDEYGNSKLDAATGMTIYWQNDAQTLNIGLVAPAKGWVAIGFDPDDEMEGANIIIGFVSGSALTIRDHYGSSPHGHTPDASQDIIESAGKEVGNTTTIEFSIPLDSGDPSDKPLQPGGTYEIILGYHATADNFTEYHGGADSTTHFTLD